MGSKYQELKRNRPAFKITNKPKEIHFKMISCMCDNESKIVFRKNKDGEYTVIARNNHCNLALSNYQMGGDYETDLIWAADEGDWGKVINILNSGTELVESFRSR